MELTQEFSDSPFDVVISSLAFYYIKSFEAICKKVYACLKLGGSFQLNIPFSLLGMNKIGIMMTRGIAWHWAVDHYQSEGLRETTFITENVIKYHRTFSTYVNDLIYYKDSQGTSSL